MDVRDADGQDGGEELETPETTTTPSDERSFRQQRNDRQRESRGALRRWEFLPTPTMELREFSSVRPWGAPVDEIEQQRLVGSDRGAEGDELEPAADPGRWYRPASVHLPDATDDQSTRLTLPRWSVNFARSADRPRPSRPAISAGDVPLAESVSRSDKGGSVTALFGVV